jgi:hypothetical protein
MLLSTYIMGVISIVAVALRLMYKAFVTRVDIGLDDWLIVATSIFTVPSMAITGNGLVPSGLGRDIWTLTSSQITNCVRYFYHMAYLYFAQTTLLKLTIIAFYMRIFPAKDVQRLLWGTFIFTSLWGLSFVITAVFQCRPISYFWTRWDGLHEGHCVEIKTVSLSNAAMNIALDVWILSIPMWQLRKLHLRWQKKVPVAIMFLLGTL